MRQLWQEPQFQQVAGDIWRPGGLALTQRAVALARQKYGLPSRAALLDLGCGAGASAEALTRAGFHVLGLDQHVHPDWSGRMAACPDLKFLQADAACPPLPDHSRDALLCECVLSLLPEPQSVLRCWRDILRPDGVLLLTDLYIRGPASIACGKGDRTQDAACSGQDRCLQGAPVPQQDASVRQDLQSPASVSEAGCRPAGCAAGARPRAEWEALLQTAGWRLCYFEDHSRALVELAARLLWYGPDSAPQWLRGTACASTGKAGYGLWIARKETP